MEENFDEKTLRDYADGTLTGAALQAFERRLKSDPDLQAELDLYLALKASDNLRLKKLLLQVADSEKLAPLRPPAGITRRLPFLLAAAAAVALLVVAVWWWRQPDDENAMLLAQDFIATPYPPPVATMGEPDERSAAVQTAFLSYRNGDFAAAAQQLAPLAAGSDEILFYTGESFLQTGQAQRAVEYFERVGPGYWREIADWRCALALIQSGNPDRAKPLLEKLRGSSARHTQAEILLKAME